jgi:LL-diaminopimelate aminotransferase
VRPSSRLERIPPYLFAELERKVAAKRAAGIDVISLGIGDPDHPTYEPSGAAARRTAAAPSSARRWPRSTRGASASISTPTPR